MTQSADGQTTKVVMHNNLVRQATHGLAKLGSLEHKIIAIAVAEIDHRGDTIPDIDLEVAELARATGTKDKDIYRKVRAAARNLRREEIMFYDPETGDEVICGWMSVARHKKGGVLTCKFADDLKPVLVALRECRTEMELASIMQIGGSAYAHRLYQIACSWRNNHGWTSRIDVLREQLGVDDGAYGRAIDFRRYVLDGPIKIINERTDVKIGYAKGNKGRSWTHIKFTVLSQSSKPQIKHAQQVKEEDEWWLDQCESEEGMDEIWGAAYGLGLVNCRARGSAILSNQHSLYAERKRLYFEWNQTSFC